MELEAALPITGGRVVRPGTFQSLGTLNLHTRDMLSFVEDVKYLPELHANPDVTCIVCSDDVLAALEPDPRGPGLLVCRSPRVAFFRFHNWLVRHTAFYRETVPTRVHDSARIHPSAVVADHNVIIGEHAVVGPNAVVHANTTLEEEVVIHANATVGGAGFEYKRDGDRLLTVEHGGGVRLHAGVEVLANAHIGRGLFGTDTELGEQTRVGEQVHVAHNVRTGKRCLIAARSAISGSTILGDDVWVGVGAVLADRLSIGDGAHISIGAVVVSDVAPGARVTGNFAIAHERFLLNHWNAQR